MPPIDERQVIRDAMDRLLAGKPIRSNGALTIVSLAAEADVKRHLLTHRHTDLREEFNAKVRSQGQIPQSEVKLHEEVAKLQRAVTRLRERADVAEAEVALLRRMNNVLAVENEQMKSALEDSETTNVSSLRPR